jgi:CRISPR/Cas system CMR subunit Cmr4 (Cas7 group RAMP superfamily)
MTQILNGEIKTISSSGQISLGKAFAGKVVKLEHLEDGRWMVTPVQVIPEHLMWAYTPEVTARLEKHLAKNRASTESDLDAIEAQILEQQ